MAGRSERRSGPSPERSITRSVARKGAASSMRAQWSSASPIAFQDCALRGAAMTAAASARASAASATRMKSTTVAAPPGEPHSTMATAMAPRGRLAMTESTPGCESASA